MRKTIAILLAFLLSFANGCKNEDNNSTTDEGEFLGVLSNVKIDFDNQDGAYNKDFIIDEKLALEIGNSILKSIYGESMLKNSDFIVYEVEGENIFVVSRVPKDNGTLGDDYNIAINKKNGAVLKIWAGE